jgi:3-(3-hydroxy-phenyl)propionate hydroxylase
LYTVFFVASERKQEQVTDNERVLIAGAGPVGYTAALNLAHYGIPFTIFEAADEIFEDPRAGTIHPPTLEMFEKLNLADRLIERGYVVNHYHYRDRKEGLVADFDLGVLAGDSTYPYRLMLEQHKLSHIIDDALGHGDDQKILRRHQVLGVQQDGDGVRAEVKTPGGIETFRGRYMIGCDGGRSQVRKSMNVDFQGITFPERFLVVTTPFDFAGVGYALTNYIADPEEWCALFKLPGLDDKGIWRALFPTDPEDSEDAVFSDRSIEARLQGLHPKAEAYGAVHRNFYEVHQRVASCYRAGRILVAGDAAHVNNPLGGMGMNFGIHDVFNLTEKLAAIWFDGGDESLLDLYDRQRRTVASEFLQRQTMENKRNIEQKDPVKRKEFHDQLRAISKDRDKLRTYLRRAAMIEGVERAASIA